MRKPVRPKPEYEVVTYTWVVTGRRETLSSKTANFASLAEAKASLINVIFYTAKIYLRNLLVAVVRGTQKKGQPLS